MQLDSGPVCRAAGIFPACQAVWVVWCLPSTLNPKGAGHGMGGALASLFALVLRLKRPHSSHQVCPPGL